MAGLRPTSQRLQIARLLFGDDESPAQDRHFTPDQLFEEAIQNKLKLSLATIYNTLGAFKKSGLIQEVIIGPGQSYYDTNLSDHHHFFEEDSGNIIDIHQDDLILKNIPTAPDGKQIKSVQVVIRIGED